MEEKYSEVILEGVLFLAKAILKFSELMIL